MTSKPPSEHRVRVDLANVLTQNMDVKVTNQTVEVMHPSDDVPMVSKHV